MSTDVVVSDKRFLNHTGGSMKICTQCRVQKSLPEFYQDRRVVCGVKAICKDCDKTGAALRYAANRNRGIASSAAWIAANPERKKKSDAVYHAANHEKRNAQTAAWRLDNANAAKVGVAAWHQKNPYKRAYYSSARRASVLRATPSWANIQAIEDFYSTAAALGMHTGDHYHVDHRVPLQGRTVCGLHVEHNLQIIPAIENLRKGNKHG